MRARRTVVSAVCLGLAFGSVGFAQGPGKKTSLGVFAGGAFDKPGGPDASEVNGTYTGWAVGGFVAFQLTPSFAIVPQASYVQKGAKISDATSTGKLKIPYFEIPVLAHLRIPPKGGSIVSPHVYAGPALGFKAGCRVKLTEGTTTISDTCDAADVKVKSTDFGLTFGGGVDIGRAIVDVRYDLGLSKLGDTGSNDNVKNRTIYLLAGWTFRAPR